MRFPIRTGKQIQSTRWKGCRNSWFIERR